MPIIAQMPERAISSAYGFRHPKCSVSNPSFEELQMKGAKVFPAIEYLSRLLEEGTIGHLPCEPDDLLVVWESPVRVRLLDDDRNMSDLMVEGDDLESSIGAFLFAYYGAGQVAA